MSRAGSGPRESSSALSAARGALRRDPFGGATHISTGPHTSPNCAASGTPAFPTRAIESPAADLAAASDDEEEPDALYAGARFAHGNREGSAGSTGRVKSGS
jgi:hypothetical protein